MLGLNHVKGAFEREFGPGFVWRLESHWRKGRMNGFEGLRILES